MTVLSFHCSVRSVMHKHLMKMGEVTFDKIFNQKLGEYHGKNHPVKLIRRKETIN